MSDTNLARVCEALVATGIEHDEARGKSAALHNKYEEARKIVLREFARHALPLWRRVNNLGIRWHELDSECGLLAIQEESEVKK